VALIYLGGMAADRARHGGYCAAGVRGTRPGRVDASQEPTDFWGLFSGLLGSSGGAGAAGSRCAWWRCYPASDYSSVVWG